MVHTKVFEQFKQLFPEYLEMLSIWFPSGKNAIRVRKLDGKEFIFTFNGSNNWRFETVDSYIKSMKGAK